MKTRMELIKVFIFFMCVGIYGQGETPREEIIRLYKENYYEWVTSKEIRMLQEEHPEIKAMLDSIPIQQTSAYREAVGEIGKGGWKSGNISELFGDSMFDFNMEVIQEILSPENTDVVTYMYWKIINSSEAGDIGQIVLGHMQKIRRDLEDAVKEMPDMKN